jgi:MFS family permease
VFGGEFHLDSLTHESARPQWLRDDPRAPWAAVGAVCLGAFMGQLDASIVTLTYPRLQSQFHTGLGSVAWVSLAYLLVLVVFLVPVGRWADSRGRKLLYLYGFVLFTLASAACAVAPSLGWLVAGRGVQAVGAALLQANSVALVVLSVPAARIRTALGLQGAAQAAGLALGPTVGGVLVDAYGWRSVFWVNVPVGIVAIIAGQILLPRSRNLSPPQGGDLRGSALLAISVAAALLVLSGLSGLPLPPMAMVGLALSALAAGSLFWRVESCVPSPLVDVGLLRHAGIGPGLGGALLAYQLIFAPLVLYPTVFAAWRVSTSAGGLVLSCLPVGFALSAVGTNVIRLRGSNRGRVRVGSAGVFGCLLASVPLWPSPGAVAVLLLTMGIFLGLAIPANNAMIMADVPGRSAARTGGMVNVARALGTSLGVAVTAIGIHVAQVHEWATAPVVLGALAVAAIGFTATTLARSASSGGTATTLPARDTGPTGLAG